jgi:hypothetical protein
MANKFYPHARERAWKGEIDLTADPLELVLMDASYVPANGDEFLSDVVADEFAGSGYTGGYGGAGRKAVTGAVITVNEAVEPHGTVRLDFDDVSWASLDDAIGVVLLVKKGTTDDTDAVLIAAWDVDPDLDADGQPVNLVVNGTGALGL